MRILAADFVIPVSADAIGSGAIAFDGAVIKAVSTRVSIAAQFPGVEIEDLGRAAIIPGLVNCHSHLEITAMRGLLDDVEHDFTAWLLRLNDTRENRLSETDIDVAARAGALEGAAAGVTCFGDIGRRGHAGLEALKAAGLRGVVYQETNFSPDDRTADRDFRALVEKIETLRKSETDLVRVGISPHAAYTVGPKLFSLIARYALAEKLKVSIHAAESIDEELLMQNGTGFFAGLFERYDLSWKSPHCSPIEYLERTGILQTSPLLAHCIRVTDADISLIRKHSASVAHCPKSNAKFGHGYAPLEKFLNAGVKIGLGSDSVASNNVCDIFEESRFASLSARNVPGTARFISAREMFELATLGGARALGLDAEIGSLEVGKKADIAVISLDNIAQAPINDNYASLIYASNARDVRLTIVNGDEVHRKDSPSMNSNEGMLAELEVIRRKIKP